jgi:hypothetical protein
MAIIVPMCSDSLKEGRSSFEDITPEMQRTENYTIEFLTAMHSYLFAETTKIHARMDPSQFTRERILTFPRMTTFLLYQHPHSLGTRVQEFFAAGGFDPLCSPVTASAVGQARMKINPLFFKAWLNYAACIFYRIYQATDMIQRWKGFLLYAIDGTRFKVPDTADLRECCSVQSGPHYPEGIVQAHFSLMHDVLNKISVDCAVNGKKSEKNFVLQDHLVCCPPDAITLMDRGYEDYAIFAAYEAAGNYFIIRAKLGGNFKQVNLFLQSGKQEDIVTLKMPASQKTLVRQHNWPEMIQVRLVKIILPNDDPEVLITSLLDKDRFPAEDFGWVYHQRWGVETPFNFLKNQLDIERFSSAKIQAIAQDVYAMAFLNTFETILEKEAEATLQQANQESAREYDYQLNRSVAHHLITNLLPSLLLTVNLQQSLIERLQCNLLRNIEPIRPDRSFIRKKLTPTQRLNHQLFMKKR